MNYPILIFATMLIFSNLARAVDVPKERAQLLFACRSGFELLTRINYYVPRINVCQGENNCFMTALGTLALAFNNIFIAINEDVPVCNNTHFKDDDYGNHVMHIKQDFAEEHSRYIPIAIFSVEGKELSDDDKHKKLAFVKTDNIKNYLKTIKLKPLNGSESLYEMGLIYHFYNRKDEYHHDAVGYFNVFLTYRDPGEEQLFFLICPQYAWEKNEEFVQSIEEFHENCDEYLESDAYIYYESDPNRETLQTVFNFFDNYSTRDLPPQGALSQTKNKATKSINPPKNNYSTINPSGLPPAAAKKRPRSEEKPELPKAKKAKKATKEKPRDSEKEKFINEANLLFGASLVQKRNTLTIKDYDLLLKISQRGVEISYHYGSNKPISPITCDFSTAIKAIGNIKNKHTAYKETKERA